MGGREWGVREREGAVTCSRGAMHECDGVGCEAEAHSLDLAGVQRRCIAQRQLRRVGLKRAGCGTGNKRKRERELKGK